MMKKNWIRSFGLADERFIDEANPYRVVKEGAVPSPLSQRWLALWARCRLPFG